MKVPFGVDFDDGSRTVWDYEGTSTRTDNNGEFRFAALPHEGVSLYVSGEGLKSRKIAYQKGSAAVLRILVCQQTKTATGAQT